MFWSGNFIIGRYIHEDVEPVQLALFRWIGVVILIIPVLLLSFSRIIKALRNNFIILNFLAILGISGFNTILYIGLSYTKATNALLINSFIPILILIFSYFILKSDIRPMQLVGIFFSTIGVVYLVLKGEFSSILALDFNYGDLWVVLAAFIWALYSVFIKFKPKELGDFEFFATIVCIGLFWLVLVYLFMGYSFIEDISLAKKHYMSFLYISFFPSLLSYYFWHIGIKDIGASRAGQFTHLMPLFGFLLAYILLDERLSLYHVVGAILIGLGIYLSLFIKKETR